MPRSETAWSVGRVALFVLPKQSMKSFTHFIYTRLIYSSSATIIVLHSSQFPRAFLLPTNCYNGTIIFTAGPLPTTSSAFVSTRAFTRAQARSGFAEFLKCRRYLPRRNPLTQPLTHIKCAHLIGERSKSVVNQTEPRAPIGRKFDGRFAIVV